MGLDGNFLITKYLQWVLDVREKVTLPDGSAIPLVLLANKCDVSDAVISTDEVSRFCHEHGIAAWFVTSAKENLHIGNSNLTIFII
jgi:Ras-related protein Rab-32